MWLDFRILDGSGAELYRQGQLDGEGRLAQGTRSFKVVLGDEEGKVIDIEVWKATRILHDNRILPRGYADVSFDFKVPAGSAGKLALKADLNYHSFSQPFLNNLLGKEAPRVPTVTMTSLSEQLELAAP